MEKLDSQTTSRRTFLTAALAAAPLALIGARGAAAAVATQAPDTGKGPFTLPPLPYRFDALEPHIDARTMQIHHDKHHATYVKNLNDAAAKTPELAGKSAEELIRNLSSLPEAVRTMVRNNAGGHVNHTLFWSLMRPHGGGPPTGQIAAVLNRDFGGFDAFKTAFNEAGVKRFGSGWVWLVRQNEGGKLAIVTTPNQDNPLMPDVTGGGYPILGNDVWEHAYYLKYQNRRADYLKAWWNTINWNMVNQRLAASGYTSS